MREMIGVPGGSRYERMAAAARALRDGRYRGAAAVFAAGSIMRGEDTAYSDLDLVVVYPSVEHAHRESFTFDALPVEVFVHDPETLEYFFVHVDRPSGVPSLAQMIVEGVEIPPRNDLTDTLKRRATAFVAEGPPPLDPGEERRLRYGITDLLDDVREPRSRDELVSAGGRLYERLANYHLRRQRLWSARGKAIPRALHRADPAFAAVFGRSFDALFKNDDPLPVVRLTDEIVRGSGGPLFDGYRADAPSHWRLRSAEPLAPRDDRAIDALYDTWADAFRHGDVDRLLALLTDDYVLWAPGMAPMTVVALRGMLQSALAAYEVESTFERDERIVRGDLAFERGSEIQTIRPRAGGEPRVQRQRVFLVLRRDDEGRWRFARGMTQP